MRQTQPRLKTVALEAGKDPQRPSLFHWLWKHHARLAPGLSERRVDWGPVIAAAITAGVTDGRGGNPSERTIRRTWHEACADRERRDAAQAAKSPRKLQPRDLPKDWRPQPIAPALLVQWRWRGSLNSVPERRSEAACSVSKRWNTRTRRIRWLRS